MSDMGRAKLVVLICEQALERLIEPDLLAAGANGFSVAETRGRGARGSQDARWFLSTNLRYEILCEESTAQRIIDMVDAKYSVNYGLVTYVIDVEASRAAKF